MKEATGKTVAIIGALLYLLRDPIKNYISGTFRNTGQGTCTSAGGTWTSTVDGEGYCTMPSK